MSRSPKLSPIPTDQEAAQPKKTLGKKRGPKPKIINQEEFEKLCGLQCTQIEIASWMRVSVDTLERWCERTYGRKFAEIYREKRGIGKISLRRAQWQLAQKNAALAIWLGKQWLDQGDKLEIAGREGGAIEIEVTIAPRQQAEMAAAADTRQETADGGSRES